MKISWKMNEKEKNRERGRKVFNDTPPNWIVEINELNKKKERKKKNQERKLIANENNDGKWKRKNNNHRT